MAKEELRKNQKDTDPEEVNADNKLEKKKKATVKTTRKVVRTGKHLHLPLFFCSLKRFKLTKHILAQNVRLLNAGRVSVTAGLTIKFMLSDSIHWIVSCKNQYLRDILKSTKEETSESVVM